MIAPPSQSSKPLAQPAQLEQKVDPPQVQSAPQAAPASDLNLLLEKFVSVVHSDNTSSHLPWEGVCTKCGWHTQQITKEAALTLVKQHVQAHWREVVHAL